MIPKWVRVYIRSWPQLYDKMDGKVDLRFVAVYNPSKHAWKDMIHHMAHWPTILSNSDNLPDLRAELLTCGMASSAGFDLHILHGEKSFLQVVPGDLPKRLYVRVLPAAAPPSMWTLRSKGPGPSFYRSVIDTFSRSSASRAGQKKGN